jgi:hypothetical protein
MSSPSLVPDSVESGPLYFVLCDYGPRVGLAFYEADPTKSDRETVVKWLALDQYTNPKQVIEIDLAAGTSRVVTNEIMAEVAKRLKADTY